MLQVKTSLQEEVFFHIKLQNIFILEMDIFAISIFAIMEEMTTTDQRPTFDKSLFLNEGVNCTP